MKRLYRSKSNKMIGGVCYGMANYFEIDPAITRLLAVFLGFMSFGLLFLIYLFFWIILPEETIESAYSSKQDFHTTNSPKYSNNTSFDNHHKEKTLSVKSKNIMAVFFIIIGFIAILDNILPQEILNIEYIFPAFLIFIGILMISQGSADNENK